MCSNVTAYDLLISCPSDVSEYINIIEKEVIHFNNFFGRFNDMVLRPRFWLKDTYSQFGDKPENLIVKQIVDSSDILLGILWTRFGSPTEYYDSGTEEEIERMINMGKQVFLFFLNKKIDPSQINLDQYKKVKIFKQKYQDKGICIDVFDEKDLIAKFRENLELYFYQIIEGAKLTKRGRKKEILWVDDRPENNVYERNMLEKYNLGFTLALTTQQALHFVKQNDFSLIISDLNRKEGKNEGYILLKEIRKTNKEIPFIIFADADKKQNETKTIELGGQAYTNNPLELINLVIRNLLNN